ILEPADFELLPVERAGFDGAAIMIRHDLAFFVEASDRHSLIGEVVGAGLEARRHQILRAAVERHVEFGTRKARALHDRLIVAGEKALRLAQPGDAHRPEIVLEERACRRRIRRPHRGAAAAGLPQRHENRPLVARTLDAAEGPATYLVGRERGEMIVVGQPSTSDHFTGSSWLSGNLNGSALSSASAKPPR